MTMLTAARLECTAQEFRQYGWTPQSSGAQAICSVANPLNGATASLRCDLSATPATAYIIATTTITTDTDYWVSFRFEIDAVIASGNRYQLMNLSFAGASGFTWEFAIHIANASAANVLEFSVNGARDPNYTFGISTATEYLVEMRCNPINQNWYFAECKIGGTLVYRKLTPRNWNSTGSTGIIIDFGASQTAPTNMGIKVDYAELTLNDDAGSVNNKWPGNGITWTSLVPNGAGSNLAYTAWSNDYLAIDEAPTVDGATDRMQETTLNDKEGWTMSSATISTIRCLAHIMDWQRTVVIPPAGSVGLKFLTWDGAEAASAEYLYEFSGETSFAYGPKGQCIIQETQPSDASAWDQSTLDALECGVHMTTTTAGNAIRLYAQRSYWLDGAEGPTAETAPAPYMWAA